MMNCTHLLILTGGILLSCGKSPVQSRKTDVRSTIMPHTENRYAIGFDIQYSAGYAYLTVFNPWKNNDTLATYVVADSGSGKNFPAADFTFLQPVNRTALLSSTFIGMFIQLNSGSMISAASDARLICDPVLYERYMSGELTDLGESVHLNAEAIVGHAPDFVMKYIFGNSDPIDRKIIEAGIPIVYNLEFMEPHPLGRSEWIKFVAAFIGKQTEADSIFERIETDYLHYSALAAKEPFQPTVMDGSSYKGVWYTAGGNSYPAKLYADAGADYYWKKDSSRGSLTLSIETMIDKQREADYWIGSSSGSIDGLLAEENRYTLFKSFTTNNVFHFGKRKNPNGGLDYFESGVTRPDVLLKDLISVFHPHLVENKYEPYYLERIK
jgi:iron complex transport system substrate-binding protein